MFAIDRDEGLTAEVQVHPSVDVLGERQRVDDLDLAEVEGRETPAAGEGVVREPVDLVLVGVGDVAEDAAGDQAGRAVDRGALVHLGQTVAVVVDPIAEFFGAREDVWVVVGTVVSRRLRARSTSESIVVGVGRHDRAVGSVGCFAAALTVRGGFGAWRRSVLAEAVGSADFLPIARQPVAAFGVVDAGRRHLARALVGLSRGRAGRR